MKKLSKKINKEKVLWLLTDIMCLVGIAGIIFNMGRIFQGKLDKRVVETTKSKYQELYGEYQYYRAHSYILYGEEWYQEQGLLPK